MVLDAVSNFVRGETDAAVDSTQTTISVVDASIFPDPSTDGEYNVVIWDAPTYPRPDQDPNVEVLRVTAIDTGTNDLTVTRGQEGTAGTSHPSGSAVHLSPTAKMFGDIESTFGDFWNETTQELTADVNNQSVNTEEVSIGEVLVDVSLSANQTISSGTVTKIQFDNVLDGELTNSWDTTNHNLNLPADGKYLLLLYCEWNGDAGWSTGDDARPQSHAAGSTLSNNAKLKIGTNTQGTDQAVATKQTSGTTVDFRAFQSSGADKTLIGGTANNTRAKVVRFG